MTYYTQGFRKKKKDNYIHVTDKTDVFIPDNSKIVIIGTMISYRGRYLDEASSPIEPSFDFFYPNISKNGLWVFLKETFNIENLSTKEEKEDFLKENNIGMTNIIHSAYCEPESSDDSDIVIESFKDEIVSKILKSEIVSLYFTSINARNLFSYHLTIKNVLHEYKAESDREVFIINGREFQAFTLPNPTNRGKSGETKEWKLSVYKKMFLNNQ